MTPSAWNGCCRKTQGRILRLYALAYLYARSASQLLDRLRALPAHRRKEIWTGSEPWAKSVPRGLSPLPAVWFGPYSDAKMVFVSKIFEGVLERFERGYKFGDRHRPVSFQCLGERERCRAGLLANASIYGTVRICPRLLRKPASIGSMVVLHELLHQKLGVGDRKDEICNRGGGQSRCYRRGALLLVEKGAIQKALTNNDNYALFARAVYRFRVQRANLKRKS